jgi:hypothetical protein
MRPEFVAYVRTAREARILRRRATRLGLDVDTSTIHASHPYKVRVYGASPEQKAEILAGVEVRGG